MKPSQLTNFLQFGIKNKLNILIKGKPGIGKTDCVSQACESAGARLIVSHPVVSDPTDYKGLPFATPDGKADFLPFGELSEIIEAKEPTVFFLDDFGMATPAVQSSAMHLLLARRINGHKISDHVSFVAATNRREDKANVQGILEPVKSRFASIVELEVNTDDWVRWAVDKDMPTELVSFIRYRPAIIDESVPTKDIINSPSPRTVTAVGRMQNAGLPKDIEFEVFKGAAGEAFATEYTAFLRLYRELPDLDGIILNPEKADVPTNPAVQYALSGALGARMNESTLDAILRYLNRLPAEIGASSVKIGTGGKKQALQKTKEFTNWAVKNADVVL